LIRHVFLILACLSAPSAAGAQAAPPTEPIQPAPVTASPTDAWQRAMQDMRPVTPEDIDKFIQRLGPNARARM
jgi:hypothetical protein